MADSARLATPQRGLHGESEGCACRQRCGGQWAAMVVERLLGVWPQKCQRAREGEDVLGVLDVQMLASARINRSALDGQIGRLHPGRLHSHVTNA